MLYEVAVLERPTERLVEEEGAEERLVMEPACVIAQDAQSAAVRAVMDADLEVEKARMEVLVRPFAKRG